MVRIAFSPSAAFVFVALMQRGKIPVSIDTGKKLPFVNSDEPIRPEYRAKKFPEFDIRNF
jgi:hypothetical protein